MVTLAWDPPWPLLTVGKQNPFAQVLNSLMTTVPLEGLYFFKKIIYLFIFGCVGSSFLCEGFL